MPSPLILGDATPGRRRLGLLCYADFRFLGQNMATAGLGPVKARRAAAAAAPQGLSPSLFRWPPQALPPPPRHLPRRCNIIYWRYYIRRRQNKLHSHAGPFSIPLGARLSGLIFRIKMPHTHHLLSQASMYGASQSSTAIHSPPRNTRRTAREMPQQPLFC